jgi:hypothetical protein
MERFEYELMRWIDNLQPHEWIMILAGVIVVGAVCMKGLGSRPNA